MGSLAMPVKARITPVDCICMCCDGLSIDSGFHGVHDVAMGAADPSVTGATGVVDLAASVADKDINIVGDTSLVMGASGLMVSG